jgi:hypothetical protein
MGALLASERIISSIAHQEAGNCRALSNKFFVTGSSLADGKVVIVAERASTRRALRGETIDIFATINYDWLGTLVWWEVREASEEEWLCRFHATHEAERTVGRTWCPGLKDRAKGKW